MHNVVPICYAKIKRFMQFYLRFILTLLSFIFVVSLYNYAPPYYARDRNESTSPRLKNERNDGALPPQAVNDDFVVHLAVVSCGERLEEPLMMLKSAVMMGTKPLHLHIFADDNLRLKFNESVNNVKLDKVLENHFFLQIFKAAPMARGCKMANVKFYLISYPVSRRP